MCDSDYTPPFAAKIARTVYNRGMPESASAPPAEKSPAKKPPARGFSRWALKWLAVYPLLLVAAAGGVLYAAYQQPKLRPYLQPHWHEFAARVPLLQRTISAPPETAEIAEETGTVAAEDAFPEFPKTDSAADSEVVAADSPENSYAADSDDSDSFSAAENDADASADSDSLRRDEEIIVQLAQMRDEIARLRNAVNNRAAPDSETRLELIDLRLRLDGDTRAAAAALSSLQNAPGINLQWLAAEIARLNKIAPREEIVNTLQKLILRIAPNSAAAADSSSVQNTESAGAQSSSSVADSFGEKIAASLKRVFNVQRIIDSENASPHGISLRQLRRMETLLLTGRRAAYLSELAEFAALPSAANAEILPLARSLQQFGAPIYAIQRPETR